MIVNDLLEHFIPFLLWFFSITEIIQNKGKMQGEFQINK